METNFLARIWKICLKTEKTVFTTMSPLTVTKKKNLANKGILSLNSGHSTSQDILGSYVFGK